MTNLDIETFWAVVQHGTMTAAAEALYITQPSLSARLKALEDQVGAPLFHRGKGQRRITLTDAGQHFLPLARRWQNLLSETQTFAAAGKREFLHVIAAYTANQYILPPVYQRFLERELPVNLWVESMRTDQAVSAVARGDADMAIVDGALHYDLQIEAKPLFREGFFLVVPKTVALTEPVEATTLHVQDEILIYGQPEILQWHDYWYGVDARPLLYTDTPQLAFLQATILVAGLMVFKDHALLGLGLMLSAGEIPRIAGAFGLDTTTRANISSAVYTAQSAVSMTRTVVAAVK